MADEIARRRLRKFKPVEVRKDAPFGEDVARAALFKLQSRSFPNRKYSKTGFDGPPTESLRGGRRPSPQPDHRFGQEAPEPGPDPAEDRPLELDPKGHLALNSAAP